MKSILLILCFYTLFQSCIEQSTKVKGFKITKQDTTRVVKDIIDDKPLVNEIFASIKEYRLPHTDSTNFDNFNQKYTKNPKILDILKLSRYNLETDSVDVKYRVPLSQNYISIVVSYYIGDNELFSTLLNIDRYNEVIDELDIAYDEVAESFFQKFSTIHNDKIEVTEVSYFGDDKPTNTISIYKISDDGKFKLQ